jgi:Tol biopolymer transport system component
MPLSAQSDLATGSGVLLATLDRALWTIDLDGGARKQIASPPNVGYVSAARWSPDGARVAYAVTDQRPTGVRFVIRVAAADGSDARTIVEDGPNVSWDSPVWAADGQSLFARHAGLIGASYFAWIERIDLNGGEPARIAYENAQFDVSPDGKWMAIVHIGRSIDLMDMQSSAVRTLVPDEQFVVITAPRFDPSSRKLAFSAALPGALPPLPLPPGLLPQIGWIVGPRSVSAHGLPQDVWTVDIDGGAPTRLALLQGDDPVAAWSPNGLQVAVLSEQGLITRSINGSADSTISTNGASGSVDWTASRGS